MELPHIGKQCFEKTCKQLDFLPMKCDACSNIFCKDHIHYSTHSCPESYKKDNQVPVCPLCNTPIPVGKGVSVDVVIGQHIDNDCQSDPAKKRRKIYTNRCSNKGCKTKELIPVLCDKCQKNFCLKHRLELDHDCKGFEGTGHPGTKTGAAAVARMQQNKPNTTSFGATKPHKSAMSNIGRDLDRERRERQAHSPAAGQVQAGMSEDEALARAIQMSLAESSQPQQQQQKPNKSMTRQEQEDLQLAQALAASEEDARRQRARQQQAQPENKSSCMVS